MQLYGGDIQVSWSLSAVLNSAALTNRRSSSTTSVAAYAHVARVLHCTHTHTRGAVTNPLLLWEMERRSAGARGTRDRQRLVTHATPRSL